MRKKYSKILYMFKFTIEENFLTDRTVRLFTISFEKMQKKYKDHTLNTYFK